MSSKRKNVTIAVCVCVCVCVQGAPPDKPFEEFCWEEVCELLLRLCVTPTGKLNGYLKAAKNVAELEISGSKMVKMTLVQLNDLGLNEVCPLIESFICTYTPIYIHRYIWAGPQ